MRKSLVQILILILLMLIPVAASATAPLPDKNNLRSWVKEMKMSPRGPFTQIRWFCNDGTIQPPKEYACKDHDGGVQHGEWTDRVKALRANGYYIANVFADIDPEAFLQNPDHTDMIKQMIVEQFLIDADDGWILHKARFYRGALQAEDEAYSSRDLLLALVAQPRWRTRYLVLREAVKLFPHGRTGAPISEMRQLSLAIAEQDKNFEALRIKIHVKPELGDATRVRTYAIQKGIAEWSAEYERLATVIEKVFKPSDLGFELQFLSEQVRDKNMVRLLNQRAGQLSEDNTPWIRFVAACRLMAALRDNLSIFGGAHQMIAGLNLSLTLEDNVFRSASDLLENLEQATRRERLAWLREATAALYGSGIISERQRMALTDSVSRLTQTQTVLIDYKTALDYAALVPGWADRSIRFHFSGAVDLLTVLEPMARRYVHDRLRGSLLLFYAAVLDSLLIDVNKKLGIQTNLFGQAAASGLHGLNAGLSRGVLRVLQAGEHPEKFDRNGIYVLPATTEDLPPVAGIITAGKGNMLSHVQLLARNLGIPNVAVDKKLLPRFGPRAGQKVVLAVSPGGIVQLVDDNPRWDDIFSHEKTFQQVLIRPDLNKLNLDNRSFIPLQKLRAIDSGRIAGPKAANLGELKFHFPDAVADGLVIPFGLYRTLLDQPMTPGGPPAFSWMREQYGLIQGLGNSPQKQELAIRQFLTRIQQWIVQADPGQQFRDGLREAMQATFGAEGTYGVFVRSDTNVEDLPGFTGAGLNLTVANVVGFENILKAISRVWASPFTARAYHWRQAYMQNPEHVYASVLLQKSVPADKSGVMVTADVDSGQMDWLTIAVNEGVGGAVSGQTAEELRVHRKSGRVRLMAHATEPNKRIILGKGGMKKIPASGTEAVLSPDEITHLINFAESVPRRFPKLLDADGRAVPADIEFGFYRNQLVLFQIRPFLESTLARQNLFLNRLDQELNANHFVRINLDEIPGE
jgi:hypothetical protein